MQTILVATDLSERSDRALERALALAAEHGATCHVISVVDDALPVKLSNQLAEGISERLHDLVSDRAETAEITVLRGETVEMLTRFALLHEADLMVLGLHRPRRFLDTVRETTMERLVASSPVPVLLVVNPADAPYRHALVPVSFSESCAGAIKAVARMAPGAEISPFHALHVPLAGINGDVEHGELAIAAHQDAEVIRARWAAAHALPKRMHKTEIVTGGVIGVMEEKLAEHSADLLAIGAHTRSGLTLHRLGGIAADLVREPPVDLLVSPPPKG